MIARLSTLAQAESMLDGHVARGALSPADKVTHLDGIKQSPLGIVSGAALLRQQSLDHCP